MIFIFNWKGVWKFDSRIKENFCLVYVYRRFRMVLNIEYDLDFNMVYFISKYGFYILSDIIWILM